MDHPNNSSNNDDHKLHEEDERRLMDVVCKAEGMAREMEAKEHELKANKKKQDTHASQAQQHINNHFNEVRGVLCCVGRWIATGTSFPLYACLL